MCGINGIALSSRSGRKVDVGERVDRQQAAQVIERHHHDVGQAGRRDAAIEQSCDIGLRQAG